MNINARYVLVFAMFGLYPPHLYAASFDCTKASSGVEQRVCSNKELSELDKQLSSEYKKALKIAKNPSGLRQSQKEWLEKRRDGCNDPAGEVHAGIDYCLKPTYQNRIVELRALSTPLERVLGVYTKRNPSCSLAPDPNNGTRNIQVCDGFNEDRISVQKDRTDAFDIEMRLFFFNGHICTFEGRAIWKEGKLVAKGNEDARDDPCTFELYSDGRHIITKNAQPGCSRYCGVRGSLNGVEALKQ